MSVYDGVINIAVSCWQKYLDVVVEDILRFQIMGLPGSPRVPVMLSAFPHQHLGICWDLVTLRTATKPELPADASDVLGLSWSCNWFLLTSVKKKKRNTLEVQSTLTFSKKSIPQLSLWRSVYHVIWQLCSLESHNWIRGQQIPPCSVMIPRDGVANDELLVSLQPLCLLTCTVSVLPGS